MKSYHIRMRVTKHTLGAEEEEADNINNNNILISGPEQQDGFYVHFSFFPHIFFSEYNHPPICTEMQA